MIKMIKSGRGFTLIELLVVIAIIAILSSVILIGLAPTRIGARDSRRIEDLNQVRNALELYFNRCGFYPGPIENGSGPCGTAFSGLPGPNWSDLYNALTQSGLGVLYISQDPGGAPRTYQYGVLTSAPAGSSYILDAVLEDPSGNNPALINSLKSIPPGTYAWTGGSAPTCNATQPPYTYCIGL